MYTFIFAIINFFRELKSLSKSEIQQMVTYFTWEHSQTGWESPILADWLEQSIHNASNAYWGKPAALMGEGGSIPYTSLCNFHLISI